MVDLREARSFVRRLRRFLPGCLRKASTDRRGAVALIVALAAPALIGFTALGTDVGYWYGSREALQAAVDAAAFSVARLALPNAPPVDFEAFGVAAANMAANSQFPGTSQCMTNASTCAFNRQNLIVSIAACYKEGKGVGNGEIKCPGDPDYHPGIPGDSGQVFPYGAGVTVTATIPQPVFFVGALMNFVPVLQLQSQAIGKVNQTPPPNNTCVLSVGNTGIGLGGSFHEGGQSFTSCGNTDSQLTQINMVQAQEGYLNQTAYHLNDNGGALPPAGSSNLPKQAPDCNALYDPSKPAANAGHPSSTMSNGMPVYFGPAAAKAKGYSFSSILVQPGSVFCDSRNACTVPAGAYCGGLQIDPGVTLNFADSGGSSDFMILDGNLVVPSIGVTYGQASDPNATFQFGGSSVGWLMQNTQTAIYPGEIQNGTIVYTTTTTSVVQNTGGIVSEDQICPGGVIATGLGARGVPTCPAIEQKTNSAGQTNTDLSTSQTVPGRTTQSYSYSVGSTPVEQVDTYVTKITFQNGVPIYSQASETTTTSAYDQSSGQYRQVGSGGSISLSMTGAIGGNLAATPDATSDDCQAQTKNNLFSSQTPAGQGYSFGGSAGQGFTRQVDTIEVCGTGPQLIANPTGSEIIASGMTTNHVYLTE